MLGDPQYTYLILDIPFLIIWLLLWFMNKPTRKEQIIMSLLFLPLGSLSEVLYFKDYWLPLSVFHTTFLGVPILLEDLIFSFAIAGSSAVLYEVIRRKMPGNPVIHKKAHAFIFLGIFASVTLGLFSVGVNSILATSAGLVILALLIIARRHDLLEDSIVSGFAVMVMMFVSYMLLYHMIFPNIEELITKIWLLDGTPLDLRIWGIPLTEMIWGFSFGMAVGPLYEFLRGFSLKRA